LAHGRDCTELRNGDTQRLIAEAIKELPADETNPSHVYARILREALHQHYVLDKLHLGDVLVALRTAGYLIDAKSGRLRIAANDPAPKAAKPRRAMGGRT
jgi:hypothetical protein